MSEQEYVIKATIAGMIKILQHDFNMPYDEAKFMVYILMNQNNSQAVNVSKKELDLWYMTEQNKYTGQLLDTHLAISFSDTWLKLSNLAYIFIVKYLFTRKIDLITLGYEFVGLIISSIKKIKDTDYCIYARIVELNIANKGKLFNIQDIITFNKDGKCDYQNDEFSCPNFAHEENCSCNEEKIKLTFQSLEKQKIIKPVGNFWMLIK